MFSFFPASKLPKMGLVFQHPAKVIGVQTFPLLS